MKKCLLIVQILAVLIFVAKIAAVAEMMQKPEKAPVASKTVKKTPTEGPRQGTAPAIKDIPEDGMVKARDLFKSLEAKKSELEKREQSLKSEEQRLLALKKEIVDKIEFLRTEEERFNALKDSHKTVESQRYKDLAKVLETTPPAKAGVMLEQLDVQTAAGITMNMKRDKAGAIWGYLSPQKAVEITREVTRAGKQKVKSEK